ncbi:dihydroxy-acid dehydratase domain-containing protein [Paraburkholderia podalyriae]|uniref:dihydroxy-acid dehydratase domain-containing protein n=1 Tax=Paraburkholderia podalyriae TaxID=1938811 RepID=UPI00406BB5AC
MEGRLAVTAGTCAVMGTASTMALIAETLGMMLPGSAAIPAVHADRLRNCEETGALVARMALSGGPKPAEIVTPASVRNALRVLLAVSGSTSAVIHLAAIAGRIGLKIDYDEFNRLSDETPVLVDLKPVGNGYMGGFPCSRRAGGRSARTDAPTRCDVSRYRRAESRGAFEQAACRSDRYGRDPLDGETGQSRGRTDCSER